MKNTIMDQPVRPQPATEKKSMPDSPVTTQQCSESIMKGLKIENVLYCLDTGTEKYLFASEDEAIEQLKKLDKKNINPDSSQIVQVLTTGNTWKLTQVPWSHIAVKLL